MATETEILKPPVASIGLVGWLRKNASKQELRLPPETVARAFAGIAFAFRPCPDDPKPLATEQVRTIVDLALHGFSAPAACRRGVTP